MDKSVKLYIDTRYQMICTILERRFGDAGMTGVVHQLLRHKDVVEPAALDEVLLVLVLPVLIGLIVTSPSFGDRHR